MLLSDLLQTMMSDTRVQIKGLESEDYSQLTVRQINVLLKNNVVIDSKVCEIKSNANGLVIITKFWR